MFDPRNYNLVCKDLQIIIGVKTSTESRKCFCRMVRKAGRLHNFVETTKRKHSDSSGNGANDAKNRKSRSTSGNSRQTNNDALAPQKTNVKDKNAMKVSRNEPTGS